MSRFFPTLACFLMLCGVALGDDWRATLTPPQAGRFPPMRAQKSTYKFGWSGFSAARADFDFSQLKNGQLKLVVTAKTTGVVRSMWRMDLQQTAFANAATLRPIYLQQTETYKEKTLLAKVSFAQNQLLRWHESNPPGDTPVKWRKFACADVFDIHTALLFVRSQRLKEKDVYRLVVYPARDAYLAEMEVVGRERITVAGKEYPAIKFALRLQGITKALELEQHKKFKRAYAWMSDDRDRILLKTEAEVFVGSVWTELESVKFSGP